MKKYLKYVNILNEQRDAIADNGNPLIDPIKLNCLKTVTPFKDFALKRITRA